MQAVSQADTQSDARTAPEQTAAHRQPDKGTTSQEEGFVIPQDQEEAWRKEQQEDEEDAQEVGRQKGTPATQKHVRAHGSLVESAYKRAFYGFAAEQEAAQEDSAQDPSRQDKGII